MLFQEDSEVINLAQHYPFQIKWGDICGYPDILIVHNVSK